MEEKGRGRKKGRKERRKYREMCRRKKREEGERLIREAGEARTENKVWEIVNREGRKTKGVDKGIQMREWKEHFMELLGGVEERVLKGKDESANISSFEQDQNMMIVKIINSFGLLSQKKIGMI